MTRKFLDHLVHDPLVEGKAEDWVNGQGPTDHFKGGSFRGAWKGADKDVIGSLNSAIYDRLLFRGWGVLHCISFISVVDSSDQ